MNLSGDQSQERVLSGIVSYGLPMGILCSCILLLGWDWERAWPLIHGEFGIAENIQLLTLGIACGYAVFIFQDQRALAHPWLVPWITLIMIGSLFLIGEEMSWGQHFFGWSTPEGLELVNTQKETNIHNTPYFSKMHPTSVLIFAIFMSGGVHYLLRVYAGRGLIDSPWWLFPSVDCIPIVILLLIWLRVDGPVLEWLAGDIRHLSVGSLRHELRENFIYYFTLVYLISIRGGLERKCSNLSIPLDPLRRQRFQSFGLALSCAALAISVLQGIFFAVNGPGTNFQLMALATTLATGLLAGWYIKNRKAGILGVMILLLCWDLGVFVVHLLGMEISPTFRLLQVAIILAFVMVALMALFAGIRILTPVKAALVACSLVSVLFLSEMLFELFSLPPSARNHATELSGHLVYHPDLGMRYPPHAVLASHYPDNPRGVFEEEKSEKRRWSLNLRSRIVGYLHFFQDHPTRMRVAIWKIRRRPNWMHMKLEQIHLFLQKDHKYIVRFRARADTRRDIIVNMSMGMPPWEGVGLHERIELTSEWQEFSIGFVANRTDKNARLSFGLGGNDISVELEGVQVRHVADWVLIEPDLPTRYQLSYRLNAMGCRDKDYQMPPPPDSVRILLLGNSYTLGVGVAEEQTFATRLEQLLNDRGFRGNGGKRVEVINCGVNGYGTREQRLFYEQITSRYDPHIVLLVMTKNDEESLLEYKESGYGYNPGPLGRLFNIWAHIQTYRYDPPSLDFSSSLQETVKLHKEVINQGKRFGVIVFRNDPAELGSGTGIFPNSWVSLVNTLSAGLGGFDIPILDLRDALFQHHTYKDLIVHELLDGHPNEIAHGIAAQEIFDFLGRENFIRLPQFAASPTIAN